MKNASGNTRMNNQKSQVELTPISEVQVYPNPNKGTFTLLVNNPEQVPGRLIIYNNIGINIYQDVLDNRPVIESEIRLQQVKKGVYIIMMELGQEVIHQKFIVE